MEIGEYCFHEFELVQIKSMKGAKVTAVTTGHIETSGNDLSDNCFPLNMRNKTISDNFEYYSNEFHKSKFSSILNYPDIHRRLVNMWVDACNSTDSDSLEYNINKLKTFYDRTINYCELTRSGLIDGVHVIGR